jgi:large subunit ribosomal protein L10
MRPEKQLLLDEIKDKIDASQALVFARYQKLAPNLASKLRMDVAKTGGSLEVVRKTIFLKAAQIAGVSIDPEKLEGHIAVFFAEQDPVQTTKLIYQFCQDNESILQVIGGQFEGKMCSAQDMEQISKLPSQNEMRAQLLGLFEAPMAQMLSTVEALLTSVIHCLENKAQENNS